MQIKKYALLISCRCCDICYGCFFIFTFLGRRIGTDRIGEDKFIHDADLPSLIISIFFNISKKDEYNVLINLIK